MNAAERAEAIEHLQGMVWRCGDCKHDARLEKENRVLRNTIATLLAQQNMKGVRVSCSDIRLEAVRSGVEHQNEYRADVNLWLRVQRTTSFADARDELVQTLEALGVTVTP